MVPVVRQSPSSQTAKTLEHVPGGFYKNGEAGDRAKASFMLDVVVQGIAGAVVPSVSVSFQPLPTPYAIFMS